MRFHHLVTAAAAASVAAGAPSIIDFNAQPFYMNMTIHMGELGEADGRVDIESHDVRWRAGTRREGRWASVARMRTRQGPWRAGGPSMARVGARARARAGAPEKKRGN